MNPLWLFIALLGNQYELFVSLPQLISASMLTRKLQSSELQCIQGLLTKIDFLNLMLIFSVIYRKIQLYLL